jgi:hypothetical protein
MHKTVIKDYSNNVSLYLDTSINSDIKEKQTKESNNEIQQLI